MDLEGPLADRAAFCEGLGVKFWEAGAIPSEALIAPIYRRSGTGDALVHKANGRKRNSS